MLCTRVLRVGAAIAVAIAVPLALLAPAAVARPKGEEAGEWRELSQRGSRPAPAPPLPGGRVGDARAGLCSTWRAARVEDSEVRGGRWEDKQEGKSVSHAVLWL